MTAPTGSRPTTLVISNDFGPRIGGIESFVTDVCRFLDHEVVVLTCRVQGSEPYDRAAGFPIFRRDPVLLPSRSVTAEAVRLLHRFDARRVIFGAAAPLSLMAPALRAAGATKIIGISHGHEIWWGRLPPSRALLRRMVAGLDRLTVISEFTAGELRAALPAADSEKLIMMPPPVDPDLFHPDPARREGAGADGRDGTVRCVAAARFVARKGIDVLLRAWQTVRRRVGAGGELIIVGDGPQRRRLQASARQLGIADSVRWTGPLTRSQVAAELRRADLFALPVRTRLGGLEPEGLGLIFAEAAATGLPILVGDSGGAPETVRDGVSGYVLDPHDHEHWAGRIVELIRDPGLRRRMGAAGRDHAVSRFGADRVRATLRELIT
ncbi:glycosyltransferase family 4 protein [Microlunatus speluncae]|uniref:glycosyltransferase family 4 protein n=1 Tax=Microlunatus speluncae TaxID=2594267 RepID=UPI00137648F0|nr:glycosyltransferase family 4 protein [Microlunatus speluncae]